MFCLNLKENLRSEDVWGALLGATGQLTVTAHRGVVAALETE
jgi:hypothetical protein